MDRVVSLGIVIPAFNEEAAIDQSMSTLLKLMDELQASKSIAPDSFMAWVDDGSRDGTWDKIAAWAKKDQRVRGVKLSRNFGHQSALVAGLEWAHEKCDATLCIDADLQHDIRVIPEFLKAYQQGAQIVYGVKTDRATDSWFKRVTAETYYGILKNLGVNVIHNHADFRLMSRAALGALLEHQERNLFLRGMIPTLGFKTEKIAYQVQAREFGVSKYSLFRMLSLAWEGVTSFSVFPLRMVSMVGLLTTLLSLVGILVTVWEYYMNRVVPGWSSLIVVLCFFGGIQLFSIGVLGEYIGKIYSEVKRRPRYITEKVL